MSTINNKLTVQEWTVLYEEFKMAKNPDTNALRKFLASPYKKTFTSAEREHYHHRYIQALRVKLKARTTKPSSIEKTMTRSQLFLTNNPLWAVDIKPKNIIEVRHAGVRGALVDNGYFLDYLINDENEDIRRQVIEKDLRLGLKRLDNDTDRDAVRRVLERQTTDKLTLIS